MKKTYKCILGLVLVLLMVVALVPHFDIDASAVAPTVLYMKPNSNWTQAGARFAAYFFGNGETWVSMTDKDGDGIYEVEVPAGYPNVIFCRMNPSATANNWNNKWNQTSDLTVPTDGNDLYTIPEGSWDYGNGSWSKYVYVAPVLPDMFVRGSMNGWGTEAQMEEVDGVYTYTMTLNAGSYEYKIANADWSLGYPSSNAALEIEKDNSTVTFTFVYSTKEINVSVQAPQCQHPSHGQDGLCSDCGEAVSHDYSAQSYGGSCTMDGYTEYTCSICNHSYTVPGNPAPGHNYQVSHVQNATCTEDGATTYSCTNCGDSYEEAITASGHNYVGGACEHCGAEEPGTPATGDLMSGLFVALLLMAGTGFGILLVRRKELA